MALNPDRYVRATGGTVYGQSYGVYWDKTASQLALVIADSVVARADATGITADLEVANNVRGDLLRRGTSALERFAAKAAGQIVMGDGTDVVSQAVTGDITLSSAGLTALINITQASQAAGDLIYKATASTLARLGIGAANTVLATTDGLVPSWVSMASAISNATSIDFTQEREVPLFAKTTGAIKTAANAQQDFFWVGSPEHYFELAQGVGALGADTLLAANGLTPSTTGWLLTLDNTATDSLEITQGIVLGSARSYLTGTSAAFKLRCAFLVTTRANITHLMAGFRVLGAYVTASTLAEFQTAYPEKACIGIKDNAGALSTETSKANVDVSTALAHAAAANGDILAIEVNVSAGGVVTYKLATTTPAGSTAAQMQAAVVAAYAALATDASAVAFTFTAATVVVPTIIIGASGASAPDVKLVNYYCGPQ
jgi:hypothetical protein